MQAQPVFYSTAVFYCEDVRLVWTSLPHCLHYVPALGLIGSLVSANLLRTGIEKFYSAIQGAKVCPGQPELSTAKSFV